MWGWAVLCVLAAYWLDGYAPFNRTLEGSCDAQWEFSRLSLPEGVQVVDMPVTADGANISALVLNDDALHTVFFLHGIIMVLEISYFASLSLSLSLCQSVCLSLSPSISILFITAFQAIPPLPTHSPSNLFTFSRSARVSRYGFFLPQDFQSSTK